MTVNHADSFISQNQGTAFQRPLASEWIFPDRSSQPNSLASGVVQGATRTDAPRPVVYTAR